jgi:hypothetical protein
MDTTTIWAVQFTAQRGTDRCLQKVDMPAHHGD